MPVRILLVDDHDVVRVGLRTVLSIRPDWQICGEAANGPDAIESVRNLAPDVVILDLLLPGGMSGFEAAKQIRSIAPSTKIVIFSIHDVPVSARECGADAFVSKIAGLKQLVGTIEAMLTTQPSGQASSASSGR